LEEFFSFWKSYEHLFLPTEESFDRFYSKELSFLQSSNSSNNRHPSLVSSAVEDIEPAPLLDWNLLLNFFPDQFSSMEFHPLLFRMHIPSLITESRDETTGRTVSKSKKIDELQAMNLLLQLYQSYSSSSSVSSSNNPAVPLSPASPSLYNSSSSSAPASLDSINGFWNEIQVDLLQRLELLEESIANHYQEHFYDNETAFNKKKEEKEKKDRKPREEERPSSPSAAVDPSVELESLDEELLLTAAALSLLWSAFYNTVSRGTKRIIEEFTLPDRFKTIRTVSTADDNDNSFQTFESQGIHFQIIDSKRLSERTKKQPDERKEEDNHEEEKEEEARDLPTQNTEKTLLQQEELFHKIIGKEFQSFQFLNKSVRSLVTRERLKEKYFQFPPATDQNEEDEDEEKQLQDNSWKDMVFIQKFTTVVDYSGFRIVAFVPNETAVHKNSSNNTSSELLDSSHPLVLLLEKEMKVSLTGSSSPAIHCCTVSLQSNNKLNDDRNSEDNREEKRTVYYLSAKMLLPSDLVMLNTNEVLYKQFRTEFLELYDKQRSSATTLSMVSSKELLDCYQQNTEIDRLLKRNTDNDEEKEEKESERGEEREEKEGNPSFSVNGFKQWKEMTHCYYHNHLPAFVQSLENYERLPCDSFSLSRLLHSQGINIRHLGVLYSLSKNVLVKQLLLSEMISRSVKEFFRQMSLSFVLNQKNESIIGEKRQKSTIKDYQELMEMINLSRQEIVLEIFNLIFPTKSLPVPAHVTQITSNIERNPSASLKFFQKLEQITHFYDLLTEILFRKFGLQLSFSPQKKSDDKEKTSGSHPHIISNELENPFSQYSLHPLQLFHSLCFHLQVRFKDFVYQIPTPGAVAAATAAVSSVSLGALSPTNNNNNSGGPRSGGMGIGGAAGSGSSSAVFLSSDSFFKRREFTLLDVIEQNILQIKTAERSFLEGSEWSKRFFPFFYHSNSFHNETKDLLSLQFALENTFCNDFLLSLSPNNAVFYHKSVQNIFQLAWTAFFHSQPEEKITRPLAILQKYFLMKSSFLQEYSLANLPVYLLLMILEYAQGGFSSANICYDLCSELIGKLLPFGHPLLTLPMMILSDLYLSYSSSSSHHLQQLASSSSKNQKTLLTRDCQQYGRFFLQLSLSVWKHTMNIDPLLSSSSGAGFSSAASFSESFFLSKLSKSMIFPILSLQGKLSKLFVEMGDFSEAIVLLKSLNRILETMLNSVLNNNYSLKGSTSSSSSSSSLTVKYQTIEQILCLFIPNLYQLSFCYFSTGDNELALTSFQKCYQLFNKIIFNESFRSSSDSVSPFAGLMSGGMYEILLSSLLFLYDLYSMKNEFELSLEILSMIYRVFISRNYQKFLPISCIASYQQILIKLLMKINELTIITLPLNVQTLLESVSEEWNSLCNPNNPNDVERVKTVKNNQKLTRMACLLIVEIMMRGEMNDYIQQLLQTIQKQIHEDNSLRYTCENQFHFCYCFLL
jgi:hypothetical protein